MIHPQLAAQKAKIYLGKTILSQTANNFLKTFSESIIFRNQPHLATICKEIPQGPLLRSTLETAWMIAFFEEIMSGF